MRTPPYHCYPSTLESKNLSQHVSMLTQQAQFSVTNFPTEGLELFVFHDEASAGLTEIHASQMFLKK